MLKFFKEITKEVGLLSIIPYIIAYLIIILSMLLFGKIPFDYTIPLKKRTIVEFLKKYGFIGSFVYVIYNPLNFILKVLVGRNFDIWNCIDKDSSDFNYPF